MSKQLKKLFKSGSRDISYMDNISEEDLIAASNDICFHDEYFEYIEGSCSEEGKLEIEEMLSAYPEQKKWLKNALDYELKNGKGSVRKYTLETAEEVQIPEELTRLPEWKSFDC